MKILILGSSASSPLPRTQSNKFEDYFDIEHYQKQFKLHDDELCNSARKGGKDRRTRSSMAIVWGRGKSVIFDAGPDIRYHIKKYKLTPSTVFITHNHLDHTYGLKYLKKKVHVYGEEAGNIKIKPGMKIKTDGLRILPFRIRHSKTTPTVGYRIEIKKPKKTIVYMSDLVSLAGIRQYLSGADLVFSDGSILNRNIKVHMAISRQLPYFKKWNVKKVYFTHIGHQTLIHDKLVEFVKMKYINADVVFDGFSINLK